jgi:outer membrane receptor for ferrienterochelin and colicins
MVIRGAIGKGFRSPNLKELYFNFVDVNHNIQGNLDLQPENSLNYNGSITWLKSVFKNGFLKVQENIFLNDFSNLITLGGLPDGSFTYLNIGDFRTLGSQTELRLKQKHWAVGLQLAYIGQLNNVQQEGVSPYVFTPEVGVDFNYRLSKAKLGFNLFYKFNGKTQLFGLDNNDQLITSTLQAYSLVNFSVNKFLFKNKFKIVCGAKNLMNVKNINQTGGLVSTGAVHSGNGTRALGSGRSYFISIQYNFNNEK